jgi:hypothetical protein
MRPRTEYYDKAAAACERIASRPEASWDEIQWAADSLKALGDSWPDNSEKRTEYHNRANALLSRR